MKVAIVHPWFLEAGGAEKVIDALAAMHPEADIFALSADSKFLPSHIHDRRIHTSNLNTLLASRLRFRRASFMPLFPWATEGLDVSEYDLILSSCPPVMGVNAGPDAIHISYCHTPQRAWWDLYAKRQSQAGWMERQLFIACATFVRTWEFCAMQRIDHVIANSRYIANRVSKYFRKESTVIYPPVDTSMGYLAERHEDYYLSVSRLDKEKGIEFLIHACNRLKRRLLIVGTGREEKRLKTIAGPTVRFLGRLSHEDLVASYAHCRALLFAADEDFGIVPVEAQAFGRPVIAYDHGGSLETVRVDDSCGRSDTGILFAKQATDSVIEGILRFEERESSFVPSEIQKHARQFDTSVFVNNMRQFIDAAISNRREHYEQSEDRSDAAKSSIGDADYSSYSDVFSEAHTPVATNRHPGQVGHSLSSPPEVQDQQRSVRAGSS